MSREDLEIIALLVLGLVVSPAFGVWGIRCVQNGKTAEGRLIIGIGLGVMTAGALAMKIQWGFVLFPPDACGMAWIGMLLILVVLSALFGVGALVGKLIGMTLQRMNFSRLGRVE